MCDLDGHSSIQDSISYVRRVSCRNNIPSNPVKHKPRMSGVAGKTKALLLTRPAVWSTLGARLARTNVKCSFTQSTFSKEPITHINDPFSTFL
jgi:hypothetical protein